MKPTLTGLMSRSVRERCVVVAVAAGVAIAGRESNAWQGPAVAQVPVPASAAAPAPAAQEPARARTDEGQAGSQTPGTANQPSSPPAGAPATDEPQAQERDSTLTSTPGSKALGISILGNQEAPTSLVIVPWKSSELGTSPGISPLLDDSRQPVDKDVFMRSLRYYEIRSEPAGHGGMTTGGRENAASGGSATQPSAARRR